MLAARAVPHEPVADPYAPRRGSVVIDDGDIRLLERAAAPAEPPGDLVQAGPLLVADGEIVFDPADDREGFSAGAGQFDSDIRRRAVAARAGRGAGRARRRERDQPRRRRSTTLVHRGHLLNRPYSTQDQPAPESRPVVSALVFEPGPRSS